MAQKAHGLAAVPLATALTFRSERSARSVTWSAA